MNVQAILFSRFLAAFPCTADQNTCTQLTGPIIGVRLYSTTLNTAYNSCLSYPWLRDLRLAHSSLWLQITSVCSTWFQLFKALVKKAAVGFNLLSVCSSRCAEKSSPIKVMIFLSMKLLTGRAQMLWSIIQSVLLITIKLKVHYKIQINVSRRLLPTLLYVLLLRFIDNTVGKNWPLQSTMDSFISTDGWDSPDDQHPVWIIL